MDKQKILDYRKEGKTFQEIADALQTSKATVQRICKTMDVKGEARSSRHYHPDMGTSRYPREGENVENFSRAAEDREIDFTEDRRGELYVSPDAAPDGYVLGYIVTDWAGKPRPHFLMSAMKRGWVPMKSSEHYSLKQDKDARDILNNVFKDTADEYVRPVGLILCKRREDLHQKELEVYAKRQEDRKDVGKMHGMTTEVSQTTYGPMVPSTYKYS